MKLYFIRHAEKELGNNFNKILGHWDPSLSAKGNDQAERLAEYFIKMDIGAVYSSEYIRAKETAEPIAKALQLKPIVDPRLNEFNNGLFDFMNMDESEAVQQYPEEWDAYQKQDRDFRFPGGESGAEAEARIDSFLADICAASMNIIAVSHAMIMMTLFCHLLGLPVYHRFRFHIDSCGIIELEKQDEAKHRSKGWKLIRYNQVVK